MKNRRGDIPVMHGDCDGEMKIKCFFFVQQVKLFCLENLLKSLAELLALVKQLREEQKSQKTQIQYLHQLIENCAGCQPISQPQKIENCDYANPCFPGNL
jgi:Cartilage oligomeric matrix protein